MTAEAEILGLISALAKQRRFDGESVTGLSYLLVLRLKFKYKEGAMLKCRDCYAFSDDDASKCKMCGGRNLTEAVAETEELAKAEQEAEARESFKREVMEKSKTMPVFTVMEPRSIAVVRELGLVFGNSSKQAFWGLSTQANRLSRAYEAALINLKYDAAIMGADAVVGVHFALNNSTGSSAKLVAGSSEAVMLLGTAVKTS